MSQIDAVLHNPAPTNEPVKQYAPGTPERASLKRKLDEMAGQKIDLPSVIAGKEVRGKDKRQVTQPHSHKEVLGEFGYCGPTDIQSAIEASLKAKAEWEALPWQERVAIFLKAADLIAGPYRDTLNAATMLGQSKNAFQAEVDAACELTDFFRFNAHFYREILEEQPHSPAGLWNTSDYRPLEGFVAAITPFNFTAIAGNLPGTPAMLGNTVVWKPSDTQLLAAHYTLKILKEAGLPDGVINLVAADGPTFGETVLKHRDLAGVHFTGSTGTFRTIWKTIGDNVGNYRSYPRIVGETGGKDFIFAHVSADVDALAAGIVRGAFEYQGQKCSAASRVYVPKTVWARLQTRLVDEVKSLKMGDVRDFSNFVNAVIDERAFKKISGYLDAAKAEGKILAGGKAHGDKGWFIEPTVVLTDNPKSKTMSEEIFGPVVTIYVYDDAREGEALTLCDETSPYALTGAIYAQDRAALHRISGRLRHAAGNLYLNDKPTGAVVHQQPFGGGRASGTNDKAGSKLNVYRWLSPRSIKEALVPVKDYRYPFHRES